MTNSVLKDIAAQTRQKLARYVEALEGNSVPSTRDLNLTQSFEGMCGMAQVIASYAVEGIGYKERPFASQTLKDYEYGHAALIVETEGEHYLMDTTFQQFVDMQPAHDPAYQLLQSETGKALFDTLEKVGYIKLTPQIAQTYLASFCGGIKQFPTDEGALKFLQKPPHHMNHYVTGPGQTTFSEEELKQRNLLIDEKDLKTLKPS